VILHLRVSRFRCGNRGCARWTFAEQLPALGARFTRRTEPLRAAQEHLGLALGGRPGHRLKKLQEQTDRYIRELDQIGAAKEAEVMEV
jgi:hypothetical protein